MTDEKRHKTIGQIWGDERWGEVPEFKPKPKPVEIDIFIETLPHIKGIDPDTMKKIVEKYRELYGGKDGYAGEAGPVGPAGAIGVDP